ncbi:MBL fold metallo-hydrolase [Neobacillus niacini]|uniref:MBL fold metallo-hydrolase n=1 Tax=Neobacillus niacini TaxID=86668 RepID=UPI00203FEDB8|nr:MBL fold metallo-hydrolase [Neobacillus niacini]MCM3691085.1 MBL fold metallo-hydrolase [Neobacillus niacini]
MAKNYTVEKGEKWKIGDITIESILEQEVIYTDEVRKKVFPNAILRREELAWMIPDFATEELNLKFVVQSYLIKCNGKNILIDTGKNVPGPFEDNLRAAGCGVEDIDYVLFTHLHLDHVARNTKMSINGTLVPTFPNARYLFGREQYQHYKELYENPGKRSIDPIADQQIWPYLLHMLSLVEMDKVDFIDDDYRLFDQISVYPVPGHSVGQYAIVIESKGDSAFIGGDVAHGPLQMVHTEVAASFDIDPVLSSKTREHVFSKLAGTDTLYLGMHFAGDHGGFIVKADQGYKLVQEFID